MASRGTNELQSGCRLIGIFALPAAAADCNTATGVAEKLVHYAAEGKAEHLAELLTVYKALHNKYSGNNQPNKASVIALWEALKPKVIAAAIAAAAASGHANCLEVLLEPDEADNFPQVHIPMEALLSAANKQHWPAVQCMLEHLPSRFNKEARQEILPVVVRACIAADAAECLKVALRLPKSLRVSFTGTDIFSYACRCDAEQCCRELLKLDGERTVDPREHDDAPIQAAAQFGNMRVMEVLLEINDTWRIDCVALFNGMTAAIAHDQMGVLCAEARRQELSLFPDWEQEDEALRAQLQQGVRDASWFPTARSCGRRHVLLQRLSRRGGQIGQR